MENTCLLLTRILDVAILYEIVQSAEAQPKVETQPFRAIFAAYDKVLPQYGLDPAQDQIYLRFLFRLGDKRGKNESLFQSFERLLEELGIQIEFNTDDEPGQGDETKIAEIGNTRGKRSAGRPRRASFNSMYDAEDETPTAVPRRGESRASMSRLVPPVQQTQDPRPSTRATTRRTEKIRSHISATRKTVPQMPRGRLTAEEWANDSQHIQIRPKSSSMLSGEHFQQPLSRQGRRTSGRVSAVTSATDLSSVTTESQSPDSDAEFPILPVNQPSAKTSQKAKLLPAPTRTQLLRDADTFQSYKIQAVARDIVDRWCDAALEARNHHQYMQRRAVAHDTEVLLRQAFEHWRARLHARKQAAETQRFFQRLESRAMKARNLYLLTKAFTHWVQCADDAARESSLARQHVLGVKYFYAWRDITIENQNKVQHQQLKKAFGVWKGRHARRLTLDVHAEFFRQKSLTKFGYWQWFWNFCERRAPEWHARKLRHRYLWAWFSKVRATTQQVRMITQRQEDKKRKEVFHEWLTQGRVRLANERQAMEFSNRSTVTRGLQDWVRKRYHAPLAQQVSNMVDWRVAGATFAIFVNRFRSERHAESINHLRIRRGFWTQWNDRLRSQTLAHRINDRRLLEATYRWVVAERHVLLHRLSEERLKGRWFQHWAMKLAIRHGAREVSLQRVELWRQANAMRTTMISWRHNLQEKRQAEYVAIEFHAPKLLNETLEQWKDTFQYVREMEGKAELVRPYYPGNHCFKRWREATADSRKQKRREAYIKVRRKLKINLASRLLQRWRSSTDHLRGLREKAVDADHQRIVRTSTDILDHWKKTHDLCLDQHFDAVELYENRVLQRTLRSWTSQANQKWQMEETAYTNADLQIQKSALVFLRQLRLRIIEVKAQQGKGEVLGLNYERRHFQGLLRQWREKTAARQDRPIQPPLFSARSRKTRNSVQDDQGVTRRAEEWTEFDTGDWIPNVEADASTTPIPAHLSTPSKRAARARALVQSTTPAGTPFHNRLRAQLNATPNTSRRGPFGRSTYLRNRSFGAILEDSPRTPGTPRVDNEE